MDAIVPWRLPFRLQCWHANLSTKPPRRPPAGPEHHYVQGGHGVASSRQVLLPGQRKAQGVMNLPSALSLSPRVVPVPPTRLSQQEGPAHGALFSGRLGHITDIREGTEWGERPCQTAGGEAEATCRQEDK